MSHRKFAEPTADPFAERRRPALCRRLRLLGGDFQFETDSPELLRIIEQAYAGLPPQSFRHRRRGLRVRLVLTPAAPRGARAEPAFVRPLAAPGLLCGALDGSGLAAIAPGARSALITVSRYMLRFPYHLRYESLEFAVYMLAARVQRWCRCTQPVWDVTARECCCSGPAAPASRRWRCSVCYRASSSRRGQCPRATGGIARRRHRQLYPRTPRHPALRRRRAHRPVSARRRSSAPAAACASSQDRPARGALPPGP